MYNALWKSLLLLLKVLGVRRVEFLFPFSYWEKLSDLPKASWLSTAFFWLGLLPLARCVDLSICTPTALSNMLYFSIKVMLHHWLGLSTGWGEVGFRELIRPTGHASSPDPNTLGPRAFFSLSFLFFKKISLTYSCFTMLYYFLLCSKVSQPHVYICSLFLGFPSNLGHYRALSRVPCAIQ